MRGYEKIWLLGDNFAYNTLESYYKNLKNEDGIHNTYVYGNYEVHAFCTKENSNNTKNVLSRFRNALVTAFNEHSVLPKLIVVIPDDDIINQVVDDPCNKLLKHYKKILLGLCNLFAISIQVYKDMLPEKAKREHVPHVLWIGLPTHKYFSNDNNRRHDTFCQALEVAVTSQSHMSMLRMVKFWDRNDSNLFLKEQYRYMSEGLKMYWRSVDASIRFWNVAISKKFLKTATKQPDKTNVKNAKSGGPPPSRKFNDKYRWSKSGYKGYSDNKNVRRRLSTPP